MWASKQSASREEDMRDRMELYGREKERETGRKTDRNRDKERRRHRENAKGRWRLERKRVERMEVEWKRLYCIQRKTK